MTITARYPGRCSRCGGPIEPGQQIDWDKISRTASHVRCPERSAVDAMRSAVDAIIGLVPGGAQVLRGRNRKPGYCDECGIYLQPGQGVLVYCIEDSGCPVHHDHSGYHVYCADTEACKARRAEDEARRREAAERRAREEAERRQAEAEAAARGEALLRELTAGMVMSEVLPPHGREGPRETVAQWRSGGIDHILQRGSVDGQPVVFHHITAFDDYRTHMYAPVELVYALWRDWASQNNVTPAAARAWLERYRGCAMTDVYEYIAAQEDSAS